MEAWQVPDRAPVWSYRETFPLLMCHLERSDSQGEMKWKFRLLEWHEEWKVQSGVLFFVFFDSQFTGWKAEHSMKEWA